MLEQLKELHHLTLLLSQQLVEEAAELAAVRDLIPIIVPVQETACQNTHLVIQVLACGPVNHIALAEVLEAITSTGMTLMMSNTKCVTMAVMAELMEVAAERVLEEITSLALAAIVDLVALMAEVAVETMVTHLPRGVVLMQLIMVQVVVAMAVEIL